MNLQMQLRRLQKICAVLLIALFLAGPTALAKSGTVTASVAKMRTKPSASSKLVTRLSQKANVKILDKQGKWYKVSSKGKTGYVKKGMVKVAPKATPKAKFKDLRKGARGDRVKLVQRRMKALLYWQGKASGKYDSKTVTAVKSFQKKNGLKTSGVVDEKTYNKLFSEGAKSAKTPKPANTPKPAKTVKPTSIPKPTPKPTARPTLPPNIDMANGVSSDRLTEEDILKALDARRHSAPKGKVTMPGWSDASKAIPYGTVLTVHDIGTGLRYEFVRKSGANHADGEPRTRLDTAIQLRTFGYKNTWTPRPVWVILPNGNVYAASIHNMPHAPEMSKDNGYPGHQCLHFSGSRTHNGNSRYTKQHQDTVKAAYAAS